MHTFRYFTFLIALSLVIVGCSKEAKDEAAQLERELSGDSTAILDSIAEAQRLIDAAEQVVDEPVIEEPVLEMPKKPAGDGYTVQVAGCEDRAYANYLVEKFTERGYQPFVTSITVEGQLYYRVRIGIFASLADAKALQAELNDKYSLETWVDVTVNNY